MLPKLPILPIPPIPPIPPIFPTLSLLSHKRNPCAERIFGFTLDDARNNIGCIVPTIGVEGATIGGEVGV